jgi:hypothetical protein
MDPELSALNLSLALSGDTSQLKKDIDDVVDVFYKIQDELLVSINKIIDQIASSSMMANTQFIKISENAVLVRDNTGAINDILKLTHKSFEGVAETNEDILDNTNKMIILHNKDNKLSNTSFELIQSINKTTTKLIKADQSRLILSKGLNKQYAQEDNIIDGIFEKITRLIGVIEKKNEAHQDEIDLVKTEEIAVKELTHGFGGWADSFVDTKEILSSLVDDLRLLAKELDVASKAGEKFVAINYRQYGSQQEIRQSIMNMAHEYNVLQETAEEAFIAMAQLNVPKDQMDALVGSISQFQRTTQTSVNDIATFVKSMRQAGMGIAQITATFQYVSEAQRKFGLTSADVNKVMGDTSVNATNLGAAFKISLDDFNRGKIVAAGLAKSMNLSAEAMSGVFDRLVTSGEARAKLMGLVGPEALNIKSTEDMIGLLPKLSDRYTNMVKQFGAGSVEAQMALSAISEAFGISEQDAQQFLLQFDANSMAIKFNVKNVKDLNKELVNLQKPLAETNAEANASTYMQWTLIIQELTRWVHNVGIELDKVFAPALRDVVGYIKFAGETIQQMTAHIQAMWAKAKVAFPWLETAAKYLTKAMALTAIAIGGIMIVLTPLLLAVGIGVKVFTLFAASMRGVTTIAASASSALMRVAIAASRATVVLARGFATAILTVGRAAMRVAPGILALTVAVLGVAGATYIVAEAMQVIASLGDKMWESFGAVAAIIGVVTVALIVLGAAAQFFPLGFGIAAIVLIAFAAAMMSVSFVIDKFARIIEAIPAALGAFVASVKAVPYDQVMMLSAAVSLLSISFLGLGVAGLALIPASLAIGAFAIVAYLANTPVTKLAHSMDLLRNSIDALPGLMIRFSGALVTMSGAMIYAVVPIVSFNIAIVAFSIAAIGATPATYALAGGITTLALSLGLLHSSLDAMSELDLFDSGMKMINTFASGIKSAAGSAVGAVGAVLAEIRRYLPFSDAKTGPLSDLTSSGTALIDTFSEGISNAKSPVGDVRKHLANISDIINDETDNMQLTVDSHMESIQSAIGSSVSKAVATVRDGIGDVEAKTISNVKIFERDEKETPNKLLDAILVQTEVTVQILEYIKDMSGGSDKIDELINTIKTKSEVRQIHSGFGSTLNGWVQ